MNSSCIVQALERVGPGAFRIDWFGQIYRGTASGVAVVLSNWGIDPETGVMASYSRRRTSVIVPVAFLRLFRIGDIWEDARFTGRSDVSESASFALDIQTDSVQVRPAGAPLDGNSRWPVFPLPFSEFDAHREHTAAYCASVQIADGTILVIPCMELVRFYFGASGSFLKRLFGGGFALDRLFTRVRFNRSTRAANIDLAEDLSGAAAATVARVALDRQARSAAAWIVNSGVTAAASGNRYYPKTTFPFTGETQLTVLGRSISTSDHRVFLVERLVRCTHPFPFDSLYYTTSRSLRSSLRANRNVSLQARAMSPDAAGPEEDLRLDEGTVSGTLQPVAIIAHPDHDDPFPDLVFKKIRRVTCDTARFGGKPQEEVPTVGVGDQSASSDTREAEVADSADLSSFDETALEEAPSEAIEVVRRVVGLNSSAGATYSLTCPVPEDTRYRRQGEFVEGAALSSSNDLALRTVWCSLVEIGGEFQARILVLLRGDVTRDHEDHLTMVTLESPNVDIQEISEHCHSFAAGTLTQTAGNLIVLTMRTQQLDDQLSLLRGFSLASSAARLHTLRTLARRGAEISGPFVSATVTYG